MLSTAELLRRALAKLDGGKAWTEGHSARGVLDERLEPTSQYAVKWDPGGAIIAAAHATKSTNWVEVDAWLRLFVPNGWLHGWNDHPDRTWPEVEELFERAIKLAEAEE